VTCADLASAPPSLTGSFARRSTGSPAIPETSSSTSGWCPSARTWARTSSRMSWPVLWAFAPAPPHRRVSGCLWGIRRMPMQRPFDRLTVAAWDENRPLFPPKLRIRRGRGLSCPRRTSGNSAEGARYGFGSSYGDELRRVGRLHAMDACACPCGVSWSWAGRLPKARPPEAGPSCATRSAWLSGTP
jgi:hypothetical protein